MPPIPPIAPEVEEAEVPEMESTGVKVSIQCAARDCKFNKGGSCSKPEINVSAGPAVKCESYEPGSEGRPPAPPVPPMPFAMGEM